jgi:hypothetical protein
MSFAGLSAIAIPALFKGLAMHAVLPVAAPPSAHPLAAPSVASVAPRRVARILASGLVAGTVSMLLLAWRGQRDRGEVLQAINAPSHWLFGDKALAQTAPSWRYTGWGTLIHQASSLMWATVFDRFVFQTKPQTAGQRPSVAHLAVQAAATTGVAAMVDLKLVPQRLTPGFEHHLSRGSLGWVYGSFGAGLLLGALMIRGHT